MLAGEAPDQGGLADASRAFHEHDVRIAGTRPRQDATSDDELELSDQMIGFWSAFQTGDSPNAPYLPSWPKFNRSQQWMALQACDTAESGNEPPAACSQNRDISSMVADHKLDLWGSIGS